jgi:two-component system nitrogen regulation sensor histidine kinase NtrY
MNERHEITNNKDAMNDHAGLSSMLSAIYKKIKLPKLSLRKKIIWRNRLGFFLMLSAVICGSVTYASLNAMPPFGNDPDIVFWLLNIDLIILLSMFTLIARHVVGLRNGRKRRIAGAQLNVRLVFIFSLLAAVPAITMTIFSAFFLHYGVQSWFSDRISTSVNESQAVAVAYLEEHQQVIKADILGMANDLNRQKELLINNQLAFNKVMQTQSVLRNLSESVVFTGTGRVLSRAGRTEDLNTAFIPEFAMIEAQNGDVALITTRNDDRVKALVKLHNFDDAYLFVGRMVDPVVLRHLADTEQAVYEYEQMEKQRFDLQVTITMIFLVVALLLLFAAIWFGLVFARQLVTPISELISTAERVRSGDLTARVPEFKRKDEFAILGKAFNRMTHQIQEQRDELVMANRQLDQRRRFTEAVLASVPSGIIGVDDKFNITLVNALATELFQMDSKDIVGKDITEIIPEINPLLNKINVKSPSKLIQEELTFTDRDGSKRIFLVRIVVELIEGNTMGAVITFDDITELQSAQRKAAWSDVARRIAHEIKNPLTPIQLSAERLQRKYMKQITEEPEIFSQCTDTIIHHVGDIGRMVNEFSAFARMPEANIREENIIKHIHEILVFQQQAHRDIRFKLTGVDKNDCVNAYFDGQLIRQAFTNILQNAIDSVMDKSSNKDLCINVLIYNLNDRDELIVAVSDNGNGLPKDEDLTRLMDPYVTHREKGTGLGLAIVKKIMDEHHGSLILGTPEWLKEIDDWQDLGGATVILTLPVNKMAIGNDEFIEKNKLIA